MLHLVEASGTDSPKLYMIACIFLNRDDDDSLAVGVCLLLFFLLERKILIL